ncbi:hypothetical protein BGW80DRAFT_1442042 [Lactifluus volemus]|nr:hypothetical protein BGW80DRAFT_1442042 [Lactifluus volemus]
MAFLTLFTGMSWYELVQALTSPKKFLSAINENYPKSLMIPVQIAEKAYRWQICTSQAKEVINKLRLLHTLAYATSGQLVIELILNIGPHYARTLREWRRRFKNNFQLLARLPHGYPSMFDDDHSGRGGEKTARPGTSSQSSAVDGYIFTLFLRPALPPKNAGRPGGIVHSDN